MIGPDKMLTQADLAKIHAHLSRFPGQFCGVCHSNEWEATGPYTSNGFEPGGAIVMGGPTMPVIALTCRMCFFTRYFAWLPIQRAVLVSPPGGAK